MDHLIDVLIAVVTGVAILTLVSLGLAGDIRNDARD
jgi:hypothetical protein